MTRFSVPVRSSSREANWPVSATRDPHLGGLADDVVPEHSGPRRRPHRQGREHPDRGRLAGAVGAQHAVDAAAGDREVDPRRRRGLSPCLPRKTFTRSRSRSRAVSSSCLLRLPAGPAPACSDGRGRRTHRRPPGTDARTSDRGGSTSLTPRAVPPPPRGHRPFTVGWDHRRMSQVPRRARSPDRSRTARWTSGPAPSRPTASTSSRRTCRTTRRSAPRREVRRPLPSTAS